VRIGEENGDTVFSAGQFGTIYENFDSGLSRYTSGGFVSIVSSGGPGPADSVFTDAGGNYLDISAGDNSFISTTSGSQPTVGDSFIVLLSRESNSSNPGFLFGKDSNNFINVGLTVETFFVQDSGLTSGDVIAAGSTSPPVDTWVLIRIDWDSASSIRVRNFGTDYDRSGSPIDDFTVSGYTDGLIGWSSGSSSGGGHADFLAELP
jgi:hypothetical protein